MARTKHSARRTGTGDMVNLALDRERGNMDYLMRLRTYQKEEEIRRVKKFNLIF